MADNKQSVTLMAGGDIGPVSGPTEQFAELIAPGPAAGGPAVWAVRADLFQEGMGAAFFLWAGRAADPS